MFVLSPNLISLICFNGFSEAWARGNHISLGLLENPSIFHELENSDYTLLCILKFSLGARTKDFDKTSSCVKSNKIPIESVSLPVISLPKMSFRVITFSVYVKKFWKDLCLLLFTSSCFKSTTLCSSTLSFVLDSRPPTNLVLLEYFEQLKFRQPR